jgi:hypothetical protein
MKSKKPGFNSLAVFSGKHLQRSNGPVDYFQKKFETLLDGFCRKGIIRKATARENKMPRQSHRGSFVLEWRGQVYLRNHSKAREKLKDFDAGMIDNLQWQEIRVAEVERRFTPATDEENIYRSLLVDAARMDEQLRWLREDQHIWTGRRCDEGSPKGTETKKKHAAEKETEHRNFITKKLNQPKPFRPTYARAVADAVDYFQDPERTIRRNTADLNPNRRR